MFPGMRERAAALVKTYLALPQIRNVVAKHFADGERTTPSTDESYGHVRWELNELALRLEFGSPETLERALTRLGFVQGVLWQLGLSGPTKLREQAREVTG